MQMKEDADGRGNVEHAENCRQVLVFVDCIVLLPNSYENLQQAVTGWEAELEIK